MYSHIIDEDRWLNAQRFEKQFYQTKTIPSVGDAKADITTTTTQSDQEILLKLFGNLEIVKLLKFITKNL